MLGSALTFVASTIVSKRRAIKIIRDTFLALYRPPPPIPSGIFHFLITDYKA
jgi:hypothetical protein